MADTAVLLEIITYIFQRTPPTADCDEPLTLQAPITTAADDKHKYFFIVFFSENIRLDVSNQDLFSSKDESKKIKCRLLQFLYGALRVNMHSIPSAFE